MGINVSLNAQTFNAFDNYQNGEIKSMAATLANLHGSGLSELFDSLHYIISSNVTRDNLSEIVNDKVSNFAENFLKRELLVKDLNLDIPNIIDDEIKLNAFEIFSLSNGKFEPSSELSSAINSINEIISTENDAQTIEARILELIEVAEGTIENRFELFVFYSAAYVAINSSNFWAENLVKWEDKIKSLSIETASKSIDYSLYAYEEYSFSLDDEMNYSHNNQSQINYTPAKLFNMLIGSKEAIVTRDAVGAATGAVVYACYGAMGGTMVIPGIGSIAGGVCCGLFGMIKTCITASGAKAIKSLF